ncbi:hypothetical protein ACFL47_02050 [Candidatus Latescibacterota bacterium]
MKINATVMAGLLVVGLTAQICHAETVLEKEQKRIKLNKKYDRHKLREKDDFVTDTSIDFLVEPEPLAHDRNFVVAKTPPSVKMRIIPDMVPEYFLDIGDKGAAYMLAWANWARMTRSDDNRFYFAVSDHRGEGCHINLYEYSPARNIVHKVLDLKELFGWTDKMQTDGKIHGHMGIMPDGTLWGATHYGVFPDSSWFANGYRGSWLFSYNINTHESKNWGVPLIGNALPCFNVDTKRGILFGTGYKYTCLSWDMVNKKVKYAGYPPNGWIWWRRAMLCDLETGKFWSTEDSEDNPRFVSFDPEFNKFERYELTPPPNPYNGNVNVMRGYTDEPAMDGWYYCCSKAERGPSGLAFFRFRPEGTNGPEVEPLGVTWDKGQDTLQMLVSPKGRYVYYLPRSKNSPLVQYDVKTGTKKALCWLYDYYLEKYGYTIGFSYGLEISTDGSSIVVCMNGAFQGPDGGGYGHPSLFVIDIPEEERVE